MSDEDATGGSPRAREGVAEGLVPASFAFGIATAGFQIEGGYNGPGEPANNWHRWESEGRVEPSGTAIGFWDRYEEHLDRVAGIGCNAFRLSIEWARVEPVPGTFDKAAVARYREILGACAARGLRPLVTLHHFTHPAWLGEELWLRPDSPTTFAGWARKALESFGDLCSDWVTTNECNVLAIQSWLLGMFPPGRMGRLGTALRALDHLTAAHVRAYEAIHEVQPDAVVATNNFAMSIYELDRLPLDLLAARHLGVSAHQLTGWLAGRRADYYRQIPLGSDPARRGLEALLRRVAAQAVPLDRGLPATRAALEASAADRLLDVAQLDYYVPQTAEHFRLPGHRTAGGRNWLPGRMLWDDPPDPEGLVTYCSTAASSGLDVWIVENGMCNRVRKGRSFWRQDGWTRDRYLRENLAAVVEARRQGIPITGYWHWTLADNYEWGTYEPRFGLYGVDRERGILVQPTDAMGVDAAGAYREIIAGLRRGDPTVLQPR